MGLGLVYVFRHVTGYAVGVCVGMFGMFSHVIGNVGSDAETGKCFYICDRREWNKNGWIGPFIDVLV